MSSQTLLKKWQLKILNRGRSQHNNQTYGGHPASSRSLARRSFRCFQMCCPNFPAEEQEELNADTHWQTEFWSEEILTEDLLPESLRCRNKVKYERKNWSAEKWQQVVSLPKGCRVLQVWVSAADSAAWWMVFCRFVSAFLADLVWIGVLLNAKWGCLKGVAPKTGLIWVFFSCLPHFALNELSSFSWCYLSKHLYSISYSKDVNLCQRRATFQSSTANKDDLSKQLLIILKTANSQHFISQL